MKALAWMATAFFAVAVPAAPALAHAERSASTPREDATIAAPPEDLNITFTEPPTGDAVVEVRDGCDRDVVVGIEVQNFEITAGLAGGQPGSWTVQTNVISGVDGHNTRDRWTFSVRGEPDCSAPETDAPVAEGDDDEDEDGGGSSTPLIALGAATVVLIVVGMMLRNR